MAKSSTNQLSRLLSRNKPRWPEPEKSTGTFYHKMGKDTSCWEAVGAARETFVRIAAEVKTYLDENSYPLPQTVIFSMYMIGRTKEIAEPTIMFCCEESRCRKRVRKTIEDSGILDQFPTVRVGDCSKPPDFNQPPVPLAAETPDSSVLQAGPDLNGVDVYYEPSENPFFGQFPVCTQLYLDGFNSDSNKVTMRKTTGGGLVKLGNRYFCLTVAHAFTDAVESSPRDAPDCDFEFDIGQSDPEVEGNDFAVSTSMGSISPQHSDYSSSDDARASIELHANLASSPHEASPQENCENTKNPITTVDQDPDSNSTTLNLYHTSLQVMGHLAALSTQGSLPHLDYALIELALSRLLDYNRIALVDGSRATSLYPEKVARIKPQDMSIVAVTGSAGPMKGILSGTPTFMKTPSSNTFQEVWTVRLGGELAHGDCGSWVVDSENGDLLGHIVSGSPATGVAYIIPAFQIFEDLRSRFGDGIRLPSRADFTKDAVEISAVINPKEPTPRAEEAPSKTIEEEVPIAEDSGWEDQPDSDFRASHHLKKPRRRDHRRKNKVAEPVTVPVDSDASSHRSKHLHRLNGSIIIEIQGDVHIDGNFIVGGRRGDNQQPLSSPSRTPAHTPSSLRKPSQTRRSFSAGEGYGTNSDGNVSQKSNHRAPHYVALKQQTKSVTPPGRRQLHSDRVQREPLDEGYKSQSAHTSSQTASTNRRRTKPELSSYYSDVTEATEGGEDRDEEDGDTSDDEFSKLPIHIGNPAAQDIPAIAEKAILDTGTKLDWISERFLDQLRDDMAVRITKLSAEESEVHQDFNGNSFRPTGKVELIIQTQKFKGLMKCRTIKFFVASKAKFAILFGRDTIRKHGLITYKRETDGKGGIDWHSRRIE